MNHHRLNLSQLLLIALSLGLLGSSMLLMGHHQHIKLTTDFYHLSDVLAPQYFNGFAAVIVLAAALMALCTVRYSALQKPLGTLLILISLIPLLTLFSSTMWIADLGGFPAIGSGQGVIKYFALLAIGIHLRSPTWLTPRCAIWLSVFPVLLVLIWIGGMKFTLLEAQGIEPLVKSSPLMAWMYSYWDLQTTSNLIGIYDLLAVLLLVISVRIKRLRVPAIFMSGMVFLVTQSFLFSWEAALSSDYLLSTGGHFLIKDLWFIANLLCFYYHLNCSETKS